MHYNDILTAAMVTTEDIGIDKVCVCVQLQSYINCYVIVLYSCVTKLKFRCASVLTLNAVLFVVSAIAE